MNKAQELFNKSDFAQAYYKSLEEMIEDRDHNLDDYISEYADSITDVYYFELCNWLTPSTMHYVDDAMEEGLISEETPLWKMLQIGQYIQNTEIIRDEVDEILKAVDEGE